jgi:hypothetical protein
MSDPWYNPRPSNYPGRFRLAGIGLVAGVISLFIGFSAASEIAQTIFISAGVGLVIGAGGVTLSTLRSRSRARQAKGGK